MIHQFDAIGLTFDVLLHGYATNTVIGSCTNSYFFDDKEVADDLEKISASVRALIEGGHASPLEYIQNHCIPQYGYGFYYLAYYNFWKDFF
ncbi:MAG: hypothetical protein RLZZ292_521 [Bacteroidota bacterium]|jgi:hypothetical protein